MYVLDQSHVEDFPHAFALHLTSPAFTFPDRGRSTIAIGDEMSHALSQALWTVLKDAFKEGERRRRTRVKADRDEQKLERAAEVSVKEAVFAVIEAAWALATNDGEYPISRRMFFYPVRKMIQQYTSKALDFNYFSQTLLTAWSEIHEPIKGLYSDPRGVLYEPHTDRTVQLGTRQVEGYEFPEHVFDKILYIKKRA
jgi:hypothetical protein